MQRLEDMVKKVMGEDFGGMGKDSQRTQSILRNPALRNLVAYTGDHRLFGKFRSKIKGILFGEDEDYKKVLKVLEDSERTEIPAITEGEEEYNDDDNP